MPSRYIREKSNWNFRSDFSFIFFFIIYFFLLFIYYFFSYYFFYYLFTISLLFFKTFQLSWIFLLLPTFCLIFSKDRPRWSTIRGSIQGPPDPQVGINKLIVQLEPRPYNTREKMPRAIPFAAVETVCCDDAAILAHQPSLIYFLNLVLVHLHYDPGL